MPLGCLDTETEQLAFMHDNASWECLRLRNKAKGNLRLPCCGSKVILKTLKLGTRFFAHKHRGVC